MTSTILRFTAGACFGTLALLAGAALPSRAAADQSAPDNQVLVWNQIFIDTLIATNTPNSSSQRLGAIVHTAIFDAHNGIERRYTPIFVRPAAQRGASRQAAVIAAAYIALVGLFPTRAEQLEASYRASLAALDAECERNFFWQPHERARAWQSRQRGIEWGTKVALAVLDRKSVV